MREEKKESFYNEGYKDNEKYNQHYSKSPYYDFWKLIVEELPKDSNVFDIGCGTGQFANMLVDNNIQYSYGIDFSQIAINQAKNVNPKLDFYVDSVHNQEAYYKGDYNTAICLEVLEHIDNDLEVLELIPKVDKLIISVPNYDSEGHVRYFDSMNDVLNRYANLFRVRKLKIYDVTDAKKIFVLIGEK